MQMIAFVIRMIICNKLRMTRRTPSVSASLAKGLLDFAARNSVSRDEVLARIGIGEDVLDQPDARIGLDTYQSLVTSVQQVSRDPAIALRWAASVDMSELSIVGLIMNSSPTMGEAFRQLQRYSRLALETRAPSASPAYQLEAKPTGLWMVVQREPNLDFPELAEMSFARLTCGPRRFLDRPHVLEVHFAHKDPGYSDVHKEIFSCPVLFDRDRNALRIHPDTASWPVATQPDYVLGILTDHADRLLKKIVEPNSVSEQVTSHLATLIHTGDATAESAAHALGMSRQTLYRRLKVEGTSFRELIETLRESLAREYLRAKGLSVSETAYLLGYSDPAAFSRAFKKRTGQNPRDVA